MQHIRGTPPPLFQPKSHFSDLNCLVEYLYCYLSFEAVVSPRFTLPISRWVTNISLLEVVYALTISFEARGFFFRVI